MNDLVLNLFLLSIVGGALGFAGALFFCSRKLVKLIYTMRKLENDVETLQIQMRALHAEFYHLDQ